MSTSSMAVRVDRTEHEHYHLGGGYVCYFVFDWWGVSLAIKIRLCTGLLSLLPLMFWDVVACALD